MTDLLAAQVFETLEATAASMLNFSLSGLDPNVIVGWLAVLGVTGGALYKVGRWIVDLRSDIARALELMVKNEQQLTRHEKWLIYVYGHLKLGIPTDPREEEHHEEKK